MMNKFVFAAALVIASNGASAQDSAIRANLANPIIIVKNLDASEKFYTQCFGFSKVGGGEITADVSKRTIGAGPNQKARSVYLQGAPLQQRKPIPTGLALIEITGGEDLAQVSRPEGSNAAVRGEVILSLIIEGIEEVLSCTKKAGGTILNDLEQSSSGKSRIASVIDPGGVRIEMYEYLPSK